MPETPRILIVDDNAEVAGLFERTLSEDGYIVGVVHTGRGAVGAITDRDYALAIIDMSLPDMEGADVIRLIHAECPSVRILAVSGFMSRAMEIIALTAGANAVIGKPVRLEELRTAVYRAIDPGDYWLAQTGSQ